MSPRGTGPRDGAACSPTPRGRDDIRPPRIPSRGAVRRRSRSPRVVVAIAFFQALVVGRDENFSGRVPRSEVALTQFETRGRGCSREAPETRAWRVARAFPSECRVRELRAEPHHGARVVRQLAAFVLQERGFSKIGPEVLVEATAWEPGLPLKANTRAIGVLLGDVQASLVRGV